MRKGASRAIGRLVTAGAFSLLVASAIVAHLPAAPAGGTDQIVAIEGTGYKMVDS